MSTAEILSLISTICYIVAAICLVLAVFFWIFFKIPTVIGDLSGRTARKSIARMRASNEKAGGQGYRPSATNMNRGKITGTMPQRESATAEPKQPVEEQPPKIGVQAENMAIPVGSQQTEWLDNENATEQLADENATESLVDENTTEMLADENATESLVDENETVSLHDEPTSRPKPIGGKKLVMLDEVMLIHTNEVI